MKDVIETFLIGPSPEISESKILESILRKGDTVFEVGARTGGTTRLISSLIGQEGRVIAFEPNPFSYRMLAFWVRNFPNVSILNMAAGKRREHASLYVKSMFDPGGTTYTQRSQNRISVRVERLDDISKSFQIDHSDVIVIDAEGAELECLRGSCDSLRKVRAVLVEVHHFLRESLEVEIADLLKGYGLRLSRKDVDAGRSDITINLYTRFS